MRNFKKILFFTLLLLPLVSFLFLPAITSAQGLKNINQALDVTAQGAGVKGEASALDYLALLIQILLGLIGLIFVILIIYGGFQWMTAMGAEDKITKAKKIIINSVIGLILIMLSYAIAYFVTTALEQPLY
jgi:hypothetical protein